MFKFKNDDLKFYSHPLLILDLVWILLKAKVQIMPLVFFVTKVLIFVKSYSYYRTLRRPRKGPII